MLRLNVGQSSAPLAQHLPLGKCFVFAGLLGDLSLLLLHYVHSFFSAYLTAYLFIYPRSVAIYFTFFVHCHRLNECREVIK